MKINFDCKKYSGYKPCGVSQSCEGCESYLPMGERILIIKLAAMGDVLRTTPILAGLAKQFDPMHITWVTEKSSIPLLKHNARIDSLLELSWECVLSIMSQKFDLVLNFEKDTRATALAALVDSGEKLGFAQTDFGALTTFNTQSDYALQLGLDDDLKFYRNTKTYPQIIFEMARIPYNGEEYSFSPSEKSRAFSEAFAQEHGLSGAKTVVGLNPGCGNIFRTKKWSAKNVIELIHSLHADGLTPLLLGGPNEAASNKLIADQCGDKVIDAGCNNSLEDFIGIIINCDIVVSTDTLAMHIAIALRKPTVALFGPTSASEVDLFGHGEKIVANVECAPCYRNTCEETPLCMDLISAAQVHSAVQKFQTQK